MNLVDLRTTPAAGITATLIPLAMPLQDGATVADVRDDEVIVKVDDATNTRIHFMKSAVQQVLKSAAGEPSAAESSAA